MFGIKVVRGLVRAILVTAASAILACTAARAATVLGASVEDLALASEAVVRGKVEARSCRWQGGKIVTDVVIAPTEIWRGVAAERVTVVVPGGEVGRIGQRVSGAPSFAVGEDVVVFLAAAGDGRFRVAGFAQGKYRVDWEAASPDLSDTVVVGGVVRAREQVAGGMSLDELRRRVREAR
jgi:hypothetical protein